MDELRGDKKMKVLNDRYITPLERKLIKLMLAENYKSVHSPQKWAEIVSTKEDTYKIKFTDFGGWKVGNGVSYVEVKV